MPILESHSMLKHVSHPAALACCFLCFFFVCAFRSFFFVCAFVGLFSGLCVFFFVCICLFVLPGAEETAFVAPLPVFFGIALG